jgi:hypothetical protein
MSKLDNNVANKIAELFNTVSVWEDMAKNALEAGDLGKYKTQLRMADDALIQLDDEFGIELPHTVHAYRRWFKRDDL